MSHIFPRVHFGGAFLYAFTFRRALHCFNCVIWPLAFRLFRQVRVRQAKEYALVLQCVQYQRLYVAVLEANGLLLPRGENAGMRK